MLNPFVNLVSGNRRMPAARAAVVCDVDVVEIETSFAVRASDARR